VFVIVLENQSYESTFGDPTADPYLAQTLPAQGALLENYYATGHESNANYISLVTGPPPNPQNQADCQLFDEFTGVMLEDGVDAGSGCVFGKEVQNIGTQLTAAGRNWKAYEQDMGNDPNREAAACGHPALNSVDETQKAEAGDGYAARHDPFVYFQSVIGEAAYCDAHVVALGGLSGEMPPSALKRETGLATDLAKPGRTPAFSFITPNLCEDGHDYPCTNQTSGESALADIDHFLETWIPKIEASRAYQANGLIEVTFDESDGPESDSSSCCGEETGPNTPLPGITGPGGGRIGAVLISPKIAHRVQPLLLAGELGAAVRAAGSRLRGGRAPLRRRRVHRSEITGAAAPTANSLGALRFSGSVSLCPSNEGMSSLCHATTSPVVSSPAGSAGWSIRCPRISSGSELHDGANVSSSASRRTALSFGCVPCRRR
jgi:hypothetical protein